MKYDFSIVINNQIQKELSCAEKIFNTKRISTIISKVLNGMYPYIKSLHNFAKEEIPRYEKFHWDKKIHIRIDYKIYLLVKKIYEDTNGYSMAFIIRRILEYFIENSGKFNNVNEFDLWVSEFNKEYEKKIVKKPYDVWAIMENNGLRKMGCLLWDNEKREFPLNELLLSIKYNKFLRPIELKFK